MRSKYLFSTLLVSLLILLGGCSTSQDGTARLMPVSWGAGEYLLGVRGLARGGAAETVGIARGDLLVSIDGEAAETSEAFERHFSGGSGPIELIFMRAGAEWQFSLPERTRTQSAGLQMAPMYRTLRKHDPPIALAEGEEVVVTAWATTSDGLTVLDIEIENISQGPIEITPAHITLLNGERSVIRPYHPGDLARSYAERAELLLDEAQFSSGRRRSLSVNLSGEDPITALLSLALTALPIHRASKHARGARKAHTQAQAILDRAYHFGVISAQASQEGLFFYPPIEALPIILTVHIGEERLALAFEEKT